jgi:phage terminase large subunit
MLQKTTAQSKISKLKKRIRIVQGGTSSSKTFTILPFLIQYAIQTPNSEISVVSESIPHLKRGALKDFLKIMDWTNNFNPNNFNKSNLTYKFSNGSYIEFFSADQPDKLRGARRDVLFINECNNVTFESYQQLAIRTKKFIYLDYNPTNEFWVHTELMQDDNSDFVILTYKDNEALDPSIVKEIEKAKAKAETSTYWANWWNVYGLGQIGSLQGVIFENWEQCDDIPKDAEFICHGLDFGFTNDPSAFGSLFRYNGNLYADELIYSNRLTNNDLINKFKELGIKQSDMIVADSAEPKSIEDIRRAGYRIEGAKKGADSIRNSIDTLQQHKIFVTKRSINLIKELRNYKWVTDRDGKPTSQPIDAYNHAIDGILRYPALNRLKKSTLVIH